MSQLTDHVGYEIARAALSYLPPAVREPALRVLGPAATAIIDAVLELLGADESEASQQAALEAVVGPVETLPPAEPFLDAELPLSKTSTPSESATRLAQQCGRIFGPPVQQLLLAHAVPAGDEDDDGGAEGSTPVPETPAQREEEWRSVLTELGHAPLADELRGAAAFENVDPVDPVTTAAAAAMFTPQKVVQMLRALVAILGKLHPEFLAEAERMLSAGLADTVRRTAIAASVSVAARRARMARSDLKIGNTVHRELQNLYVADHRGHHDLVVERYNRRIKRAEAVVVGPATKGRRRSFSYVFNQNLDRDLFFRALWLALATPKLEIDSRMRADLINVNRGSIWEIKPVASAVTGVWQETLYRMSFNIIRRFLLYAAKLPTVRPTSLESGSAWLGVHSAWTKVDPATPFLFTLSPIFVTTQAKQPAVAVPFQLSMLPGLVPYLVVSTDTLSKWMDLVKRLAEAARQKALEILAGMAATLRAVAQGVLEAVEKMLLVVLFVILAIMAFMMGAGRVPVQQPGVAPGTLPSPSWRREQEQFTSVMDGVLHMPWVAGRRHVPARAKEERTDINLGAVVVKGVPTEELETFMKRLGQGFESLLERSILTLERSGRALSGPAQA